MDKTDEWIKSHTVCILHVADVTVLNNFLSYNCWDFN